MIRDEIDVWTAVAGFTALAVILMLECIALYNTFRGNGVGWPNPEHWLGFVMRAHGAPLWWEPAP